MTKLRKLTFTAATLLLLLAACLPVVTLTGCVGTKAHTVAFNTLYSVEATTTAAYDGYFQEVALGNLRTNDLPSVSAKFNAFQAAMLVALDTVQYNTNAVAPPALQVVSQDLLNLIRQIRATQKVK